MTAYLHLHNWSLKCGTLCFLWGTRWGRRNCCRFKNNNREWSSL